MNADELLDLIDRHHDHVERELTGGQLNKLLDAVADLAGAGDDEAAARRALYRVRLALLPLPLDSPVRGAMDQLKLSTGGSVLAPERAHALLGRFASLASREIIASAHRRLLATPSRSGDELDPGTAVDPLAAGLIRLPDPERGPRYPDFQFEADGGRPLAVVQRINRLLLADQDPWGAADWWLGGNRWLAGTPAELVGRIPDALLTEAAQALVEGDE